MKGISFLLLLTACAAPAPYNGKDPIQETFHTKDFVYRQCYHESDSYLGRYKEENRKVDVRFQIGTDGKVSKAEIVQTDFKDPNFHACVLSYVRRLIFFDIKETVSSTQTIYFGHEKL